MGQLNVNFMSLWHRAHRRGLVLAVTFLTPKHPVQSARSFTDFIRCRSIKTGPNLQLNQALFMWPGITSGCSSAHPTGTHTGEHSSLPRDTQGLKPFTDKELAEGHLIRSTRSPQELSKGLWSKTENKKLVRNEGNGDNGLIRARWQQWW